MNRVEKTDTYPKTGMTPLIKELINVKLKNGHELSSSEMKHLLEKVAMREQELLFENQELRGAQSDLETARTKYANLYEYAPVGYFTIDKHGFVLQANQTGAALFAVDKRGLSGKGFSRFIEEFKDRRIFAAHCFEVLEKGTRRVLEVKLRRDDNTFFYAQLESVPAEDLDGKLLWIRMAVSDITERKNMEEALLQSEKQFRSIFELTQDVVMLINNSMCCLTANRSAGIITGVPHEKLIGRTLKDFIDPAFDLNEEWTKLMQTGRFTGEVPIRRQDGSLRIMEAVGIARAFSGQHLFIAHDITERKLTETALRKAHADVMDANKELEAFAYSVSHDLRSPLRSIEGFSRAIQEQEADRLSDSGKDYFRRVLDATARMGQLIDALLNLSRVSRKELRRGRAPLSALAHEIIDDLRKRDPRREVDAVIPEDVVVEGDAALLQLVLQNLIQNAWKFTVKKNPARIEFGVEHTNAGDIYFVQDNGAGFDMNYAEKLFLPFRRLHAESEFPGIGVGLATVQRIIHRHGGHIWAEGELGKGATFFFTLH